MSHVTRELDAVLLGATTPTPEFLAHVRGCGECRAKYDQTSALLRLANGGVAPGELERLTQRAVALARPPPRAPRWSASLKWAFALGFAATVALLGFMLRPRTEAGHVLVAGHGLLLDGAPATRDARLFVGMVISTGKEDSALMLEGPHGRRGLLLRPNTRLRLESSDLVELLAGRVRVQVTKTRGAFVVRDAGAKVSQTAPGIFIVEEKPTATLVAVHQGTVRVNHTEVKAGQQTEVVGGVVGAPTAASPSALIEDRPANLWDAFLRWINQLVETIAKALAIE